MSDSPESEEEALEAELFPQPEEAPTPNESDLSKMLVCPSPQTAAHTSFGVMNGPSGPVSYAGEMYTTAAICPDQKENQPIQQYIPWFKSTAESWGKSQALSRAEDIALDAGPFAPMRLYITLPEVEFDFTAFRDPDADSAALVMQRKDSLAEIQAWADKYLEEQYSATILGHSWLVNGVDVEVAADDVAALLEESFVLDAMPESDLVVATSTGDQRWSGADITYQTLSRQVAWDGYDGEGPRGHHLDNIRFGWMDLETLNCSHVGWDDGGGQWPDSRLIATSACNENSCWESNFVCAPVLSHATTVGWVAGGSIQEDQDPAYTGTLDQRKRSGVLPEMSMFFYRLVDQQPGTFRRGLEDAVARNLDVYNFSINVWETECDIDYDASGFNAYLGQATMAGLIVTSSAGNFEPNAGNNYCSVLWPATRSNVISVSSLDSRAVNDSYIDVARYSDPEYFAGWGQKHVEVVGGGTLTVPLVDLVAPGTITYFFTGQESGPNAYAEPVYDNNGNCEWPNCDAGTSFAAPIVAALAGQTREWMDDFYYFSSCAAHPSCIATNLFVMADYYSGSLVDPHEDYYDTVSKEVGYGRAYIRRPASAYLGDGAWWWETGWDIIDQGEVVVIPLVWGVPQPTSVEGVKIAVAWFDKMYEDVGDLKVELIDTCYGGRYTKRIKRASIHQTMRKKIQVKLDSQIHGRCLALRVTGLHVDGDGEKFFYAAYAYSNDEDKH